MSDFVRVKTADVIRLNPAMTIEGGAVFRFNSTGSANTFIRRYGGEITELPKKRGRPKGSKNVNTVDTESHAGTGPKSGDSAKGET